VLCWGLRLHNCPERHGGPDAVAGLPFDRHWLDLGILAAELAMGLYVLYVGVRARHPLIVALMLAQGGLMAWFEFSYGAHIESVANLFIDKLSIVMALINGLVGGGICLYALGYMRQYHGGSLNSASGDSKELQKLKARPGGMPAWRIDGRFSSRCCCLHGGDVWADFLQ